MEQVGFLSSPHLIIWRNGGSKMAIRNLVILKAANHHSFNDLLTAK